MQDDPKAAEGLDLATAALKSAMPLIAAAEEAQTAADAAQSHLKDVARLVATRVHKAIEV